MSIKLLMDYILCSGTVENNITLKDKTTNEIPTGIIHFTFNDIR